MSGCVANSKDSPPKNKRPIDFADRALLRVIALAPVGDGPTQTDKGQIRKRGGQRRPSRNLIRCVIKLSKGAAKFNVFLCLTVTLS
jgi:hypothetical protein